MDLEHKKMSDEADVSNANHSAKHKVELFQSLTVELPPSCISFVPFNTDHFIIGTYFLEEDESGSAGDTQTRSGSLLLFHLISKRL